MEGRQSFIDLLVPHNEHRILFTRVLGLLTLELFDGWYPRYQMVVNSLLLSLFLYVFLEILTLVLNRHAFILVAASAALFLGFPFAWENALGAFQSQFYFLLLFSIVSFRCLLTVPCWSPMWLAGVLTTVCAYFSMAGGVFVAVAAGACLSMQLVRGGRSANIREITGVVFLFSLAIIFFLNVPQVEYHQELKAQSIRQFLSALAIMSSWPLVNAFTFLMTLPTFLFVLFVFLRRPAIRRHEWVVVGMSLFVLGLMIGTSYGRAAHPITSRYLEITAMNVLINLVAVCYLVSRIKIIVLRPAVMVFNPRRWPRWLPHAWAGIVVVAAVFIGINDTYPSIRLKAQQSEVQAENLRLYVTTGDAAHLHNKAPLEIPYPDPTHLAVVAGMPSIQGILPSELGGQSGTYVPSLLPKWVSNVFHSAFRIVLSNGLTFVLIGASVFCFGVYRVWRRPTAPS